MKQLIFTCGFFWVSMAISMGQSRLSVAPTYWFNYGQNSYQLHSIYDGSDKPFSDYSVASSGGITLRYQLKPRWDVSIGLLYTTSSSHVKAFQNEYQLISNSFELPVLLNYRLSERRLSAYVSAGTLLTKSKTFTDEPVKASALIGIGLDYRLTSKLSLLLQPTASYSFYKPADSFVYKYVGYNAYAVGVQTQLIYHF